jgi:hypothetical protein
MRSRWPAILAVVLALGVVVFLFVRSGQRKSQTPTHLTQATKVVVRDELETHDGHFTSSVTLLRQGATFAYEGSTNGAAKRSGTVPASVVEAFLAAASAPDAGTPTDKRISVSISGIPNEPGTVVLSKLDPGLVEPYQTLLAAVGVYDWIDEARKSEHGVPQFTPPSDLGQHR